MRGKKKMSKKETVNPMKSIRDNLMGKNNTK
jgi:hypothetical protein